MSFLEALHLQIPRRASRSNYLKVAVRLMNGESFTTWSGFTDPVLNDRSGFCDLTHLYQLAFVSQKETSLAIPVTESRRAMNSNTKEVKIPTLKRVGI